jgi:DNA-directed RNA polymerase subunit M/transcription elongation factor TFIIS
MQRLSIRLKGCPRCGGDLFPEYDITGSDLVCLQCGYVQSVSMREPAAEDGRDMTVAAGASPSLSEMAA